MGDATVIERPHCKKLMVTSTQHLALDECIGCVECVRYPLSNGGGKGSLPVH